MKKLPDLYTNSFDKKIDNSLDYITIKNIEEKQENNITNKNVIQDKIDHLFKSKNYVYKINAEITFENEKFTSTLIGKTRSHLITIDNKLININDIIDIKKID